MKVTVEISEADAVHINRFLQLANASDASEANSHGPLNFKLLAEMLLQDVALAVRRPGSWEGTNMANVLASHGYEIW